MQECVRTINFALCMSKITESVSLTVPLGTDSQNWRAAGSPRVFPHLEYIVSPTISTWWPLRNDWLKDFNLCLFLQSNLPYHTSAILAAAIDTFSLRYRLRSVTDRLSDLVDPMRRYGRSVSCCSVGLPFGIKEGDNLLNTLEKWEGPFWTSITPHCTPDMEDINQRIWMQSVVLRGIPQSRVR